jgi:hypothetical protein
MSAGKWQEWLVLLGVVSSTMLHGWSAFVHCPDLISDHCVLLHLPVCLQDCALLQQGVPAAAPQGPQASLQEDRRAAGRVWVDSSHGMVVQLAVAGS